MTEPPNLEWSRWLRQLHDHLRSLHGHGMRYVNIAPDLELARHLMQWVENPPPAENTATSLLPPKTAASVEGLRRPEPPHRESRPDSPVEAWEPPVDPSEVNSLASLRFQVRNCRNCGLCETRNRLVFGSGAAKPPLMFIGEGPGAEEDARGLPFVGRAGSLLTGLIEALGLTREDVYITNTVKCRPPGNRNPEPVEMAACQPILLRQIELLDPALIVTLGNVPLKLLNPQAKGITRERGNPFKFQRWNVLPTFHPSYLLRSPHALEQCWADFRQAMCRVYPEF